MPNYMESCSFLYVHYTYTVEMIQKLVKKKLNPFIPDGNSHPYQQDQSIYVLRVASLDFFILMVNLVLVRKFE